MQPNHSIYVHIPFCRRRCYYCDFNTYAGIDHFIPQYLDSLENEIELVARFSGKDIPIHTIYFGGGTPSLMEWQSLERIIQKIDKNFQVSDSVEISIEANPNSLSLDYLKNIKKIGINRISIGMQSALTDELKLLGRLHDPYDVIQSVKWSRQAGFDNISLDLIFGLPDQSLKQWEYNLNSAINLNPEHLSLYSLIVEEETPFWNWTQKGLINVPDEDLSADMYEYSMDRLSGIGFVQYEISNWGRKKEDQTYYKSVHNFQYWKNQPYIGIGAGAHGYFNGIRYANERIVPKYIEKLKKPLSRLKPDVAVTQSYQVDKEIEIQETMMVGLRLTRDGISKADFFERFKIPLEVRFENQIKSLLKSGLLEWAGEAQEILRLTYRGRMLGNQVFMQFIDES